MKFVAKGSQLLQCKHESRTSKYLCLKAHELITTSHPWWDEITVHAFVPLLKHLPILKEEWVFVVWWFLVGLG